MSARTSRSTDRSVLGASATIGYDSRLAAFVGVCGGHVHPGTLRNVLGDAYDEQRRQTALDLQRYHTTGQLTYQPVVTKDGNGAFLGPVEPYPTEPWDYYGSDRGASATFKNQVTTISLHTLLNSDSRSPAELLGNRAGLLIAAGADVYVPLEGTREAYRRLTGPKELYTIEGAKHTDLYDIEPFATQVTEATLAWFGEHL